MIPPLPLPVRARRTRPIRTILAVLVLSVWAAAPAGAQGGGEAKRKIGDWSLACRPAGNDAESCNLVQDINFRESGKRVLNISVARLPGNQAYVVSITAPLGILLPAGLTLTIGNEELVRFPLRICNVNGCQGTFPFTQELRKRFAAAEDGQVMFRQPNGRPLRVQFSLRGFGQAFDALASR